MSVGGVNVRRSLRVLQRTPQPSIEVGFRVVVNNDCYQQDCANQDVPTNAILAAYSDAIINSIGTGALIVTIRDKASTIQGVISFENSTTVLQSSALGLFSAKILELTSASPSPEPSSLPSNPTSNFPNKGKRNKKEVKD
jgi:hypothetical protein